MDKKELSNDFSKLVANGADEEQIKNFIRLVLNDSKEVMDENGKLMHPSFDMSGYEDEKGYCTLYNQALLNKFAFLGIYDYTEFLALDFYKGTPTVYLKYFGAREFYEEQLGGYTTTEIIYEIFKLTILSGRNQRRRI